MDLLKEKLDKLLIKLKLRKEKTNFQKDIENASLVWEKLKPISELIFFLSSMSLVIWFASQWINLISLGWLQFFSWSSVINDTVVTLVFSILIFFWYVLTVWGFWKKSKVKWVIYWILFYVFMVLVLWWIESYFWFNYIKNYYLLWILFTVWIIIWIVDLITFFLDKKYRWEKIYYIISFIFLLSISVGTDFLNSKYILLADNEEYSITYTNDNYIFLENWEIFKNSNTLHLKEINNSNFFCKKFNKMCDDDKKEIKDQ